MSAPIITQVSPDNGETSVILGTSIVVTFDQLINHSSVSSSTFVLTGPGKSSSVAGNQVIEDKPYPTYGKEYIKGTFSFDDSSGVTVVTFVPSVPLQKSTTYSVLVAGQSSVMGKAITNPGAEVMATNYSWSFTTGDLGISVPPPQPNRVIRRRLTANDIQLNVYDVVGFDMAQEIDIIFPSAIDPSSLTGNDIKAFVTSILGDPSVTVPTTLTVTHQIVGSTIKITITGW